MTRRSKLAWLAGSSFLLVRIDAAACDSRMASESAFFATTLTLSPGERLSQKLALPANQEVAVIARERGIDVQLEVTTPQRSIAARSPVSRTGTQRIVLTTQPRTDYSFTLSSNSRSVAPGQVELRVVSLESATMPRCAVAQRLLAGADAAYAAGQAVTQGTDAAGKTDAAANYRTAARLYEEALGQIETRPTPLRADVQHAMARVFDYDALADWVRSEQWARTAAISYESLGDTYGRARANATRAASMLEIANSPSARGSSSAAEMLASARSLLDASAQLHQRRGERFEQALAINNIGLAFFYEGLNDRAIREYRRALAHFEALNERRWQFIGLHNIAIGDSQLGRMPQAVVSFQRLLQLVEPDEDPLVRGSILSGSAYANVFVGDIDNALQQYARALEIQQRTQDRREAARSLHGIGAVYDGIGDDDLALNFYEQALAIRTESLDPRGRVGSLRAIASILRERGRPEEALRMHQEALKISTSPVMQGGVQLQIARDLAAMGRGAEAKTQLDDLIDRQAADPVLRARVLLERARQGSEGVPYAKLEADLQEALQIFRLNTSPVESFEALVSLARLAQRQGRAEMSMEFLNQAVALAEEVRIQTTNPELRASVFQPLRPAFDLKIALLAERHRQASNIEPSSSRFALEALRTAEQARARALADFQRLDVATSKISAELLERRAKICRELAARYFRLEAMRQRGRQNEADLQIMRQEMSALRRKLDEVNTRIGSMSLQKNAVDSPLTVEALRRLPTNLAVVQYWIGEDASYAWVATRERLRMLRLSTGTTITRTATEFHTALKGFGTVAPEARQRLAERLGALLIQPIAEEVAGKQSLIFIPDGALHYVPFAALRFEVAGSQKYLVQRHDVATAVTVSGLIRASPAPAPGKLKEMLVVADPVYELGDERLSAGPQKLVMRESSALDPLGFVVRGSTNLQPLPRLKGSAIEARQIVSLLPPESVDLLDGVRASKAALLRSNVERYRYIHIGAHAIANRHAPLLSAIMLSAHDAAGQRIDDKLLAADLLNLKFNADLVVLGACDTALGKQLQGEGVLGLHYAVLARGARAVVASLWAVPDQASSALLSRYYTLVLKDRLTSYTALSQAARDTIDTGLSDPAAWAVYFTVLRTLPRT